MGGELLLAGMYKTAPLGKTETQWVNRCTFRADSVAIDIMLWYFCMQNYK